MLTGVVRYLAADEGLLPETFVALSDLRLEPPCPDLLLLPGLGDVAYRMRQEAGWNGAEVRQVREKLADAAAQLRDQMFVAALEGTSETLKRDAEKLDRLRARWFPTVLALYVPF